MTFSSPLERLADASNALAKEAAHEKEFLFVAPLPKRELGLPGVGLNHFRRDTAVSRDDLGCQASLRVWITACCSFDPTIRVYLCTQSSCRGIRRVDPG